MTITSLHGLIVVCLLSAALLALVAAGVMSWRYWHLHGAQLLAWWRSHATNEQRTLLRTLAQAAVAQVRAFATSPAAQADIDAAAALVSGWLQAQGISIPAAEIEAMCAWALAQWTGTALPGTGPTPAAAPGTAHAAPYGLASPIGGTSAPIGYTSPPTT